jgi:hypothetical protein
VPNLDEKHIRFFTRYFFEKGIIAAINTSTSASNSGNSRKKFIKPLLVNCHQSHGI